MRDWNEAAALLNDFIGLPVVGLALLILAALIALIWFTWPAVLRLRVPRRNRAERPKPSSSGEPRASVVAGEQPDDALPDLPAATLASLADQLAAEGRYAEAVRERLRAMVRELVDRQVVGHHPGWTVTELARAAGAARPPVEPPVTIATSTFSDIWYGQRPATAQHDALLREQAERMRAALGGVRR